MLTLLKTKENISWGRFSLLHPLHMYYPIFHVSLTRLKISEIYKDMQINALKTNKIKLCHIILFSTWHSNEFPEQKFSPQLLYHYITVFYLKYIIAGSLFYQCTTDSLNTPVKGGVCT